MHIPDGYLSPSTCAVMYATAAPFWYVALQRLKKQLTARMVPLLSIFAAFSFVVMMFNLPLPGGTTGHAVGMGVVTVVLGPWASIVAISIALLIQALYFGDGGVTCYGANSFNMAIVGSLVAWLIYRAIAGRAPLTAPRRVIAAALAGYGGINVAAFCAAVEFGIQPMLFKDAGGAPLYAPYPLGITIPAMMIGHMTVFGWAEFLISGGVVAYLQRADPSLLKFTAPGARAETEIAANPRAHTRPLWIGLAIMMLLSPLGLLAAGTAWGEWDAHDFENPRTRQQIALVSGRHAPPPLAPLGLRRLSSVWTAPMPDYAPKFVRGAPFGYILSAMFGGGFIMLVVTLLSWGLGQWNRTAYGGLSEPNR